VLTPAQELELVGRLALSAAVAGVLGWERQLGQQPAGLRTHMLVSLGACAFTTAGTYGVSGLGTVQDAGRIPAQIVTGIGFIGAGTIWRSSGNERVIRGLTTAASIWVAASIGMLCGYGLYILAIGCALVSFTVLRLMRGLERLPGAVWNRMPWGRTPTHAGQQDQGQGQPQGPNGTAEDPVDRLLSDPSLDLALELEEAEVAGKPRKRRRKRRQKQDTSDQISE
jgi:putative Mg2+ transporter-C (MgtC) family protein